VQLTHNGTPLKLVAPLKPICLVSDHYLALAFQTDQFLVRQEPAGVINPLVIDVFTLDVMAEFLDRPLRFLSYLELRAIHGPKPHASHEMTLLSYHLKYNLWAEGQYDFIALEDDFVADTEIAMGARTPKGILTAIDDRILDRVIAEIEASPMGAMIDLVLLLYQLSGTAMKELADGIDRLLSQTPSRASPIFRLPRRNRLNIAQQSSIARGGGATARGAYVAPQIQDTIIRLVWAKPLSKRRTHTNRKKSRVPLDAG
jgi:hypothetical protein